MVNRKQRRQQKRKPKKGIRGSRQLCNPIPQETIFDKMEDGNEYGSIIALKPAITDAAALIRNCLSEIQEARKGRKAICYLANVIKPLPMDISINTGDDLPFREMVDRMSKNEKNLDVILVTPGGDGQQVPRFVEYLRNRFDNIEFVLPYMCMSAGTLFALSGDAIWMDERAFIGPIDPQVKIKDGRMVPAQHILNLVTRLGIDGQNALLKKRTIPWHIVRIIDNIDPRLIGEAMSLSDASTIIAKEFLANYKFKHWNVHNSTNKEVTKDERLTRALEIAQTLCSSELWKSHRYRITRELAEDKSVLGIKIEHIEKIAEFHRAIRRFWAVMHYIFENTSSYKILISENYSLFRSVQMVQVEQQQREKND